MWARAVWLEGKMEEEGVMPLSWVNERKKIAYWPARKESKALRQQWDPTHDWYQFELIKLKTTSGMYTRYQAMYE